MLLNHFKRWARIYFLPLITRLSLSQGVFAPCGISRASAIAFHIFALWDLLDCVGAFHAVVPSSEAANAVLGPGSYWGNCFLTCVFAVFMGWGDSQILHLWCDHNDCNCLLKDYSQSREQQKLHVADTLLDLLSVLVEFWCQQHHRLNYSLVEKGLKDLAEHFAVLSQGMNKIWKWPVLTF